MSSSFNQIRSQILSLENQISNQLTRYSSFATSTSSSATSDEIKNEKKIDSQLQQFNELIKQLNKIVESQSNTNSISTSKLQQLSRHKETYNQFTVDYRRIKASIHEERSRLNLLFSVRNDIEDHQRRTNPSGSLPNGQSEEDYMLNERLRIDQQHNVMDDLLNQVFETRDEILRQRTSLNGMVNKLQKSLSTMPGLNILLSKINTRKKRDTLIIATVISVCLILLWFLM
ncbi:unnamed protein product [Ambrosiozyma monospora]|uniref:Golgi SNAP receptor complex member 1 n=1 Tax=Ambrosiozyma monospora TaxID=43982 RepID=A0A9W7DD19_AMBMO|nr:unnamed protein product [Ambrosiozyma monospora]